MVRQHAILWGWLPLNPSKYNRMNPYQSRDKNKMHPQRLNSCRDTQRKENFRCSPQQQVQLRTSKIHGIPLWRRWLSISSVYLPIFREYKHLPTYAGPGEKGENVLSPTFCLLSRVPNPLSGALGLSYTNPRGNILPGDARTLSDSALKMFIFFCTFPLTLCADTQKKNTSLLNDMNISDQLW